MDAVKGVDDRSPSGFFRLHAGGPHGEAGDVPFPHFQANPPFNQADHHQRDEIEEHHGLDASWRFQKNRRHVVVAMDDGHRLGIFLIVGTEKGDAGRFVMYLLRFQLVHPNGIGAQFRHEACPVGSE